jgi:glycerate kinase
LEVGLTHIADLIAQRLHVNIGNIPRGGAAGGLAAGAMVFLGATLVNGAVAVAEQCGLKSVIKDADWVITGEGRFDMSSLSGKTVSGVLKACRGSRARICVLAGQVTFKPGAVKSIGIHDAMACTPEGMDPAKALSKGKSLLKKAARQWAQKHLKKETLET